MGVDLLVVTLPRVLVYTTVMLDEAAPTDLTRSFARLVHA